jgi:hypothetical protein
LGWVVQEVVPSEGDDGIFGAGLLDRIGGEGGMFIRDLEKINCSKIFKYYQGLHTHLEQATSDGSSGHSEGGSQGNVFRVRIWKTGALRATSDPKGGVLLVFDLIRNNDNKVMPPDASGFGAS